MRKLFKQIKDFYDAYKIWLFALALFSTNGMQAYMNGDTEVSKPVVEPTKEVAETKEVKRIIQPIKLEVICKSEKNIYEHEKEHHGGR